MAENDYGFMEVLTGNIYWETEKVSSSYLFSNKSFDRYCAMATLISSLPTD